jgi:hypothetical protein
MTGPTIEEWRRLFTAARGFAQLRPWERMDDDEIFGVVDPESGEIGWCSVIGALGESLGLVVNVGDDGLAAFDELQSGNMPMPGPALRGLGFTLDDREDLGPRDLAPIRSLGLKFRGRQSWPCFRSLLPGYMAWHVDGPEARTLANALEQAAIVCARVGGSLDLRPGAARLLVRAPGGAGGGFEERWVPRPAPRPPAPPPPPKVDAERVSRIALTCRRGADRWECGRFEMHTPVGGGDERPFFPAAFLIVNGGSGFILHAGIDGPPYAAESVQSEFLETIEKGRVLPRQVAVADEAVRRAIEPAATRLGVKVSMPAAMPAFDAARAGLEQYAG